MPERSLRIPPLTPPDMVIAALNGALERLDAIEGKGELKLHEVEGYATPRSEPWHDMDVLVFSAIAPGDGFAAS